MGDPACWLNQLCPGCSAMLEQPIDGAETVKCWRCGAVVRLGDQDPEILSG